MTTTFHADGIEVEITDTHWRLYEDEGALSMKRSFQYARGDSLLLYHASYGEKVGMPGDRMSVDYVRSVLVGYQESTHRWLLGLHLSRSTEDKPVFRCLVRWPESSANDHVQEVRKAAHSLATYLSVPLKIFGEKKFPAQTFDTRTGVTGPLSPHMREKMELREVESRASHIDLPINSESFTLTGNRSKLTLRIMKNPAGGKGESPVFNLCEINSNQKKVKLVPPTGLLGAFMRSPGKEVAFGDIANVEYRHIKVEISHSVPSEDGKFSEEQISHLHVWGIYLTLPDESLLVVHESFQESSELLQSRISMVGGTKFDTNSIKGMEYFRKHLEQQDKLEKYQKAIEDAALVIADVISCHLVKTEVEQD